MLNMKLININKMISIIIALVITWLTIAVSIKYSIDEVNASYDIIYGDVDNDKEITVFDIVALRKIVINNEYDIVADLDGNGIVNFEDLVLLNDFLLGKITSFPIQYRNELKDVSYEIVDEENPIEISLTKEMIELTEKLATPVEVYNYLYNNIDTTFYTNSRKGAIGTFDEKCGNDVDQASLLIAMLRYLGYEAEYNTYLIGVTDQQLLDWTGCQNIEAAQKVIEFGNAELGIYYEMDPVRYTFQHTIVKAVIDDNVVYLDTSFKKYKKVKTVYDELGLYTNENAYTEFLNNELSFFEPEFDNDWFEEIDEGAYYFNTNILEKKKFDVIPSDRFDYGYDLISEFTDYNPIDEKFSDTISFSFGTDYKTFKSAELYGKNITISFDNPFSNLKSYIPIIKIDEKIVMEGLNMSPTQTQDLQISIYTNKINYNYIETLTVGEMCNIFVKYEHISSNMMNYAYSDLLESTEHNLKSTNFIYQGINENNLDEAISILYTSDNIGKLLRFLGIEWFAEAMIFNDNLKEMSNVRNEYGLSFALISYSPSIINGQIQKEGTFSTNVNQIYTSIERNNNTEKVKSNNLVRGMFESSLEKKIFKKYLDVDVISTLEIFQQAEAQEIEISKIDLNNKTDLNNLNLQVPSNVIYDLESLINNGWTILIPSSFIKIDKWGGIGYIAIDATGEREFYYRYGGYGYNGSTKSSDLNQNGRAITIPIPIPFPIVAVAVVVAVVVIASGCLVSTTVENVEELVEIEKFKNETKEIEIAKTQNYPSDNHYKVYYHATTMERAKIILSTNQLIPTKNVDGGLVYAWTLCPDERAIAGSGSQNANVIVRFETVSAFTRDITVTDEYALLFMPMRAVIPGSIPIKNPIIITNIKKNWFWRIKNILTKG